MWERRSALGWTALAGELVLKGGIARNTYDTTPKFDTFTFRLTYLFSPR
jgi:hypothetical protein